MEPTQPRSKSPPVVIDAGIATDENLKKLKEHYHYIAVSRKKIAIPDSDDYIVLKETQQGKVEAKRIRGNDEIFLYCKSTLKQQKEKSMQSRFEQNFEEQLSYLAKSIHKKGCTKRYDKVLERVGRLKEKYKQIARFYQIHVEEKNNQSFYCVRFFIRKRIEVMHTYSSRCLPIICYIAFEAL